MTSAFLVFDYYMNLMGNYIKLAVIMLYQPTLINLILAIKFIKCFNRIKGCGRPMNIILKF